MIFGKINLNQDITIRFYKRKTKKFWNTVKLAQSNFPKISAYLEKDDVHIDYACGPGSFIGLYSNSKSIGLDISMKQINYAKKFMVKKQNSFILKNLITKNLKK